MDSFLPLDKLFVHSSFVASNLRLTGRQGGLMFISDIFFFHERP